VEWQQVDRRWFGKSLTVFQVMWYSDLNIQGRTQSAQQKWKGRLEEHCCIGKKGKEHMFCSLGKLPELGTISAPRRLLNL